MKRRFFLKKILGIFMALGGGIILIEIIPLWIWYCILGGFIAALLLLILIRI